VLPDGTTREITLGADAWKPDADGHMVFWGLDREGHAGMWVKGEQVESWTPQKAGWTTPKGAPRAYIPLQQGLLRGDPGVSFFTRRPVAETLIPRMKNTAILAGIACIIVMPLALALGLLAGLKEGKFIDRLLSITSLTATATPEFASGVFLILVFSTWLGWFPGAVVVSNDNALFERPQMLILPIITLSLIELGYVLRITRASMVEVMRTNYIRTATLKGLPRWRIVFSHALRNALMAPITIIILHVNWLIGGIVVVETLFGYPGLGRYVMEAALFKDVFAIEAAAMLLVIIAVGTQLFADIIYTYLNPRIRYA
jgi:peptide/nickel transport system permease protein